jgi:hypothetical protein
MGMGCCGVDLSDGKDEMSEWMELRLRVIFVGWCTLHTNVQAPADTSPGAR